VADFENWDFKPRDIFISDGIITKIADNISDKADKIISAEGLYVLPGFVDMHAHFREPGREDEEDFYSGSLSAIKGGFTTVCVMPNTQPAIDNPGNGRVNCPFKIGCQFQFKSCQDSGMGDVQSGIG